MKVRRRSIDYNLRFLQIRKGSLEFKYKLTILLISLIFFFINQELGIYECEVYTSLKLLCTEHTRDIYYMANTFQIWKELQANLLNLGQNAREFDYG